MAKLSFTFNPFTGNFDAISSPTGDALSYAGFDANGDVITVPTTSYVDSSSEYTALRFGPASGISSSINDYTGLSVETHIDGQTALSNAYGMRFIPVVGSTTATTINDMRGIQLGPLFEANSTVVNSFIGLQHSAQVNSGASMENFSGIVNAPIFNHSDLSNYIGIQSSASFSGTAENQTDIAVYPVYSSTSANSNVRNIVVAPQFQNGSTLDNTTGLEVSQSIDSTITSVVGLRVSPQLQSNAAVTNMSVLEVSPNIQSGSTVTNVTPVNISPSYNGQSIGNAQFINLGSQFNGATTANYLIELNLGSNFSSTSSLTGGYTGVNVSSNFTSGATAANYNGVIVSPSGGLSVSGNAVGLSVNLSSLTSSNRTVGIQSEAGANFLTCLFTPQNSVFFDAGNQLVSQVNILSGSPLTGTDVVANSLPGLFNAQDDVAIGPASLGSAMVGFVGQLAVSSGKTVDALSFALAGGSIPVQSTGGTITDLAAYKAVMPFSAGGTLAVTNIYGLLLTPDFSSIATNSYSVYSADPSTVMLHAGEIRTDTGFTAVGNSFPVTIQASASTSAGYTLTLPVDDGTAGQVLTTDGSGVLSWSSPITTPVSIANGGTGQTSKAAAFDALSPMSASGDIIYGGASGTGTRLAAGTDGQVLTLASGVPSWANASSGPALTVVQSSTGGATSRNLSTIGSANYGAMANNSVSLSTGTWQITVNFQLQAGTGTGVILYNNSGLYAANGADNSTVPTALSTIGTVDGPAVLSEMGASISVSAGTGLGNSTNFTTYLTVASTQTVYAVPRIDFSSAGTANVSVHILARKIYN